jgi:hypothetical protein
MSCRVLGNLLTSQAPENSGWSTCQAWRINIKNFLVKIQNEISPSLPITSCISRVGALRYS